MKETPLVLGRLGPLLAGLSLLAGCVTAVPRQAASHWRETVPTCRSEKECAAKWRAALAWVVTQVPWKLQTVTDTIIQTFGPGNTTDTAARVVKTPMGGDVYKLVITTSCGNPFGCFPGTWPAAQAFNDYVNSVTTAQPAEGK